MRFTTNLYVILLAVSTITWCLTTIQVFFSDRPTEALEDDRRTLEVIKELGYAGSLSNDPNVVVLSPRKLHGDFMMDPSGVQPESSIYGPAIPPGFELRLESTSETTVSETQKDESGVRPSSYETWPLGFNPSVDDASGQDQIAENEALPLAVQTHKGKAVGNESDDEDRFSDGSNDVAVEEDVLMVDFLEKRDASKSKQSKRGGGMKKEGVRIAEVAGCAVQKSLSRKQSFVHVDCLNESVLEEAKRSWEKGKIGLTSTDKIDVIWALAKERKNRKGKENKISGGRCRGKKKGKE